jgi:hypothetical protein
MSDSTDANPVSAVPSGSAGEPTPTTDANIRADSFTEGAAMQTDLNEVSRLAALRQHPEVAKATAALFAACECVENARFCGSVSTAFDALLSAVAAAATAQTDAPRGHDRHDGACLYTTVEGWVCAPACRADHTREG